MNKPALCRKIFCLAILAALSTIAAAQSGRIAPPEPTPNKQAPPASSAEQNRYKYLQVQGMVAFVKQLNEFGQIGYRLETAVHGGGCLRCDVDKIRESQIFAAILSFEPNVRYEYESFVSDSPDQFGASYNLRAKKGFRYRTQIGLYSPIHIVERRNGDEQPVDFRVLTSLQRFKKSVTADLQTQLDKAVAEDYRPVGYLYNYIAGPTDFITESPTFVEITFTLLLEKPAKKAAAEAATLLPQYFFLRTGKGKKFDQKTAELAAKGFEVLFLNWYFAVMGKENDSAGAAAHKWVRGDDYFLKQPKGSPPSGAKFVAAESRDGREKFRILFEENVDGARQHFEYQTVLMSDDVDKLIGTPMYERSVAADKTALETLAELTKNGYSMREVLYFNGFVVLCEREVKK